MQVILTETVAKLGKVGDEVAVRDGFARNFLIPRNKALRATVSNREIFDTMKVELEKGNSQKKADALKIAIKLEGFVVDIIRQAGDDGRLFGSVNARDIIMNLTENNFDKIDKNQVIIAQPIKLIGVHTVTVNLYSDVNVAVYVNVSRTEDEAIAARKIITEAKRQQLDSQEVVEV
jgi:large subunit ribosomal protein L9